MRNQVFISYRQEGPEHAREVRRLGELLRQSGLPVMLDQFLVEDRPGGPDEGWPKWCEDCANESDCVLVIGSAGWFAAHDKSAPRGMGLGAAVEASLFQQYLYDEASDNPRIRLALLGEVAPDLIPVRLRAWHRFRPFATDAELNQLIQWIAQRLGLTGIEPPTVRWPEPVAFVPDLADRTLQEWPSLVDLLAGRSRERILLYEGGSGLGKSLLVRQAVAYARRLGIPVVQVDFKGGGQDVEAVLGQFHLDLGDQHLPTFCRAGACKTHLLRKDLRELRRPVLAIFDTYELAVNNQPVADWLGQQLLREVETALGLAVIVAGQQVPSRTAAPWRDLAQHIPLQPITEVAHWVPWIERRYPNLAHEKHLDTILLYTGGNPAAVSSFCDTIAAKC
ncbi:SEFIR domain-containing protein [Candidatus Thiodictyon syntrophicum]|jgi:hypothetical protein|uniref:SEFIR domain-containing protein n=1 Tax=Candidatus Thiodictyon syntrophicum TaxID=1166950 RepID=A0A2K8UCN8_9GAMM|nr:SEFIR domain-containing protein [Candidatus Thiodictyon syntrophicum]AUB83350.1 hypothetical protein THSYN_22010 [Candidatus Thiodictyon syntrophicum]